MEPVIRQQKIITSSQIVLLLITKSKCRWVGEPETSYKKRKRKREKKLTGLGFWGGRREAGNSQVALWFFGFLWVNLPRLLVLAVLPSRVFALCKGEDSHNFCTVCQIFPLCFFLLSCKSKEKHITVKYRLFTLGASQMYQMQITAGVAQRAKTLCTTLLCKNVTCF